MIQAMQARLHLPQASQLAQCSSACSKLASDRTCSTTLVVASSQFLSGARMVGSWNLEPGSSYTSCTSVRGRGLKVVCMARDRRLKMVSQQIRREISSMLLYDKVLQAAFLPETALGADMYLTAVATISEVEMSKDLSVAKVYISIYGDERGQAKALEGLKKKAGYVRKGLAQRMNLKFTPEVRFIKDEALERGSRVLGILDKLKKEREAKERKLVDDSDRLDGSPEEHYEDDEEKSTRSWSSSDDQGDESDWDDDENITFIK